MKSYQIEFIRFAIDRNVLRFGEFTLKSGRKSPFFFNAGLFNDGEALALLGRFYAEAIDEYVRGESGHQSAVAATTTSSTTTTTTANGDDTNASPTSPLPLLLFGPAYKGIPLVASTAIALSTQHQRNLPFAFNRKEAKDHGEGGSIVGTPLANHRVLIVDDVITAGTAIRESIQIIQQSGAVVAGVLVALDRQEKGKDGQECSAIQEIQQNFGIPVLAIVTLRNVIEYLEQPGVREHYHDHLVNMRLYRETYGVE